MAWESVRFKDLNKGEVFKRGVELYVLEGEQDEKRRTLWFYELEAVSKDPYCEDNTPEACEHFFVEGIPYHRGLGYEDEQGEVWEPMSLIRKRDIGQMNMKVERYTPSAM